MGVQAIKHAAMLQEWTERIAQCRSSNMTVKARCESQGIGIKAYYYWERQFIKEARQQPLALSASAQAGLLKRINPNSLPDGCDNAIESVITIRHGESMIALPAGTNAEIIADLVKALNRHA